MEVVTWEHPWRKTDEEIAASFPGSADAFGHYGLCRRRAEAVTYTTPYCPSCLETGMLCQSCLTRIAQAKAAAWTPAKPGLTGRFLKLPSDDSVPARVKVGGVELSEHGPGWSWSTRHGGWLYLECEQPNALVRVKLTTGRVIEFGDDL